MENSNIDIFKEGQEVQAGWAQFKNVGDKVQGTYVDKFEQRSQKYNQDQIIYVLKSGTTLINVGFNKSKVRLHQKFDSLKFGQIIGIEFVGTKESQNGGNPQKLYRILANDKIVDEDWLKTKEANKVVEEDEDDPTTQSSSDTPSMADPFETVKDEEVQLDRIAELAVSKLGVKTSSEIKDKVMEATNLPVVASNYTEIITKLEAIQ